MLDELIVCGIGSFILTTLSIFWITRPQLEIVPEGKQIVIYRFGKYSRTVGPGPVWYRRLMDKVERKIDVLEEPHNLELKSLYAYDIPIGYTLNLWYKRDPVAAANGDRHLERKFVQFDNQDFDEQIRVRIRDLFIKHISDAMNNLHLSAKPTVLDKLIPFCPGQRACNEILHKIRQELPSVLRSLGAVLDPSQPIAIKDFHLGASIIQLLDRDRVLSGILQRVPNGDPDLLAQAALAIEGVPIQPLNKIVVEQNQHPGELSIFDTIVTEQISSQQLGPGNNVLPIEPSLSALAKFQNVPLPSQSMITPN